MNKISRREAIAGIVASAGVLSFQESVFGENEQETVPAAFAGKHQPKPLPFDASKLKGLSEKIIKSHWENNYGGSVKALNTIERRLAALQKEKDLPAYVYGDLKREELIRTGSVVLIEKWYGSYENWESEFKKTANALSGGSGWTILAFNLHTKELHNYWASDHAHNSPFSIPLLVLDMYEHSYQMDYGAAAAKYIDAFMQNVNWEEVNRRVESATKMSL
jgi:superoxide dismutase, Fe-Mn family